MPAETAGVVAALTRFPVKSMGGENLTAAEVDERGVIGDRGWATYTEDGGIGSGKTTRRFRRVDGLLSCGARLDDTVPVVALPGGATYRADDPAAGDALSALLGQPLVLRPESDVQHHDDSPLHVITTAGVRRIAALLGAPVDASRFRANVLLDVDGEGFVEDTWKGRELHLGQEVVLRLGAAMPRCVMVSMPQNGLPHDPSILAELGRSHDVDFGLQASVLRGGTMRIGDVATLT